jgi:glutamin-(asparagin-)ase
MRPPSALSSDGPLNLYNAIVVAASQLAHGKGTLVVANDEIHTARDVVKTNTFKQEAFRSPYGPLGYIVESRPVFYRLPARPHTVQSEWSIDAINELPEVGILYAHGGMNDAMVHAMLNSGVKALIYAATGNGNLDLDSGLAGSRASAWYSCCPRFAHGKRRGHPQCCAAR